MYTFYDSSTGKLLYISSEPIKEDNSHGMLEGAYDLDNEKYNLETKEIENILSNSEIEALNLENAWVDIRVKRDALLSNTDYKLLSDSTTTKIEEWKTYRQALRDLPANTSDPLNVTWPTPPE